MVHEPNYPPLPQRGCIRLSWSQLAQNQLSFQEFVLEGAMEARRALAASGEACAVLCLGWRDHAQACAMGAGQGSACCRKKGCAPSKGSCWCRTQELNSFLPDKHITVTCSASAKVEFRTGETTAVLNPTDHYWVPQQRRSRLGGIFEQRGQAEAHGKLVGCIPGCRESWRVSVCSRP